MKIIARWLACKAYKYGLPTLQIDPACKAEPKLQLICVNSRTRLPAPRFHIYGKLGVDDRTAAVTTALEKGIITLAR